MAPKKCCAVTIVGIETSISVLIDLRCERCKNASQSVARRLQNVREESAGKLMRIMSGQFMRRIISRTFPTSALPTIQADLPIRVVLATPMYGGGHAAGNLDPQQLFSVKTIRGQLRFWWRKQFAATAAYTQSRDPVGTMARRKEEVFGSVNLPSPFDIYVTDIHDAGRRHANQDNVFGFHRFGPEAYALFSARTNNVPALLTAL